VEAKEGRYKRVDIQRGRPKGGSQEGYSKKGETRKGRQLGSGGKKGETRKGRQGRGNKKEINKHTRRGLWNGTQKWGRQKMRDERGTERKAIWKRGDRGGGETKKGKTRNAIRKKGDEEEEMK
jgi:hypothetical protein